MYCRGGVTKIIPQVDWMILGQYWDHMIKLDTIVRSNNLVRPLQGAPPATSVASYLPWHVAVGILRHPWPSTQDHWGLSSMTVKSCPCFSLCTRSLSAPFWRWPWSSLMKNWRPEVCWWSSKWIWAMQHLFHTSGLPAATRTQSAGRWRSCRMRWKTWWANWRAYLQM